MPLVGWRRILNREMERRSTRVSAAQWEIIIDFLTENPSLVRGYHNSSRGREQANRIWSRLADQLNAEGSGATKTAKEWATYFNNFKSKLKKLVADLNRDSNSTGGGPAMPDTLSEIERRVLSIMGPGFGQGLPSVRVNPFPNVGPTEPQDIAHERSAEVLSVPVNLEIGTENWEHIQVENEASGSQAGTSEAQVSPSILILPPSQPAPPPQPSVPLLERRTRHRRYRMMFVPQRYVLGVMGLFALANSFTMRVCLSMTITQMVLHVAPSEHIIGETCPDPSDISSNSSSSNATVVFEGRERYDWDEATQGFLLSAFYYGYVATHLPGGLLAEKFGGKWTIGFGLLLTSVATALTPLAVTYGGAIGLFIIRVIEGFGEGPVTPAFVLLLARWVPPSERSRFGAMIFGGAQIGNIFGPYVSGILLADGGDWANVFYVFGGLGVIWFLFWVFLCYSTPNEHPYISDEERQYLNKNIIASGLHKKLDPVPFKALLRSAPLWVLVLAAVGHDWGYFTMITDLPKYFSDVLKFNIKETGLMSALPYIAMYICSFIFASLCDLCVAKKWHSIGTGRKIYTTVSSTIPAIFIILASYAGCSRTLVVGLFIASMAFMGGFYSSVKINAMDIAPNYAGTCSAFVNGLAAVSGMVTPYLVGLLTPDQTIGQWRMAFWTMFAVLVGTNMVYLIWGSGEPQWWDDVDKYGYPPGWKHGPLRRRSVDGEKKVVHPKHDHSPVSND